MSDCAWILDGVAQFVRSPMWTAPVSNFVDDKCIFFDSSAEMKLEYTPIHNEFQQLVDGLLTTYIEELGVPMEDALEAIKASGDPTHKRLVEYLTYLDDFLSFKKLMEKRNVELEVEALRELEKQDARASQEAVSGGASPPPADGDDRDEELDAALRASQLEAELIMKEAEMEDLELQKALALSIASEHERQQKEAAAKAEGERAEASAAAEKQRLALEASNMEARKKNLEEAQAKVREVESKRSTPPPTPSAQASEPAKPVVDAAPAAVAQATPASSAPKQAEADPNAPAVVRISSSATPAASKLPTLAPLGRHGAFGGSKPLPSIHKSFKELQEESQTTPAPSAAPVAVPQEAPKQEASMEQFKARQEEIRRQRDMLLAMKKQKRNEELVQAGGAPIKESTSPSANGADAESKKLTIEIARRFRDDIVQESRK